MAQPQASDSFMPTQPGKPGLAATLQKIFIVEKLQNPVGRALLLLLAIGIAIGISRGGLVFAALALAAIAGLPVLYAIITFPRFGIVLLFVLANIVHLLSRLVVSVPLGTAMDGIEMVLLFTIIIKQRTVHNWKVLKTPVGTMLLIWIGYNLLEFFNPVAASKLAWVYTIRTVAIISLTYFIFLYNVTTVKFIRLLIKIWISFAVVAALYAAKQEYLGFFSFEEAWLHSSGFIMDLLFINGHWRKFSIYSDPVTYSYVMSVTALLAICLTTGTRKLRTQIIYIAIAAVCLICMLFSGTRGANVLVPIAMAFFCLLKFNRYIMVGAVIGGLGLAFLIFVPTSNPTLYRFQTTFRPNEDASYNVRKANQKRIQPYILAHPMGGGLGATGTWGQRFAPYSYLANFPPDSGYIRVAVELGWLGLIVFCTLMFVAMLTGINSYYHIHDPELRSYSLAALLVVFAYNIGNFPQEAIVQYPSNLLFYFSLALPTLCLRLDKEKRELKSKRLTIHKHD